MRELVYAVELEPGDVIDCLNADTAPHNRQIAKIATVKYTDDRLWLQIFYTRGEVLYGKPGRPFYATADTRFVRLVP